MRFALQSIFLGGRPLQDKVLCNIAEAGAGMVYCPAEDLQYVCHTVMLKVSVGRVMSEMLCQVM